MTATDLVCEFMPGAGPFDVAGDFYLNVPATVGASASTPDAAALDIIGDIHVRAEITLDDWTPGSAVAVTGKYLDAGDQRSWVFFVLTTGQLSFQWSTDGTAGTTVARQSSVALSSNSGRLAVGVKLDVDNGAGGNTITFETAPSLGGTWTDLADETQSGTTSIHSGTSPLLAGAYNGNTRPLGGRVHKLEIRNGIGGTVVANPDFTVQTPGDTSFTDAAGLVWTVNSPASINGFDWVDLSDRLLHASWTYGRSNELQTFEPGEADLVLKNDDRHLDPEYTAGPWFGELNPRVPFRLRSISSALNLPGAGGAHATTPDHASFNVTDLDVRAQLSMTDWTPGGFGQFIASQWGSEGNQGWYFAVLPSGVLRLAFTTGGSTDLNRDSTVATGFADGTDHWVRATLDVDNGAAGHDVRFYTSTDGVTWTQLGTTVTTAGTVTLFNSTAALAVGDVLSLAGKVRYLEVRDGIDGTIVTNPEFDAQDPGTTSFRDRSGRTWTVNGTATIELDTTHETDEFYGVVESGWGQDYRPPARADCRLRLVDLQAVINGARLPQDAYEVEVLDDNPVAFWQLDETSGVQMTDSSGNGLHGFIDNGEQGVDPLIYGGGHAFRVPHVGDNRGRWSGESLPTGPPVTLEAWINTPRDLAAQKNIIVAQRDSALGSGLMLKIETSVDGSPNGELLIDFFGLGGFYKARGHVRVDDDVRHHVVMTMESTAAADIKLYVDGVEQTKTVVSGTTGGAWASHFIWTVGNSIDVGHGDFGLDGDIDEVAIYDAALTADRVAAHYTAGATGNDGDTAGTRIDRVLDFIGVPDSMRNIATGDSTVGPANYNGQSAGTYIDSVVESEQGYFYIDHRNGGKVTFKGRYSRLTETRSTTVLHTFTDADTVGALHYERQGLRVDPNATRSVVNVVDVEWQGGSVQVVDPNGSHLPGSLGPQSRSLRTEAATASAAAGSGAWMIHNYATPQARVRGFRLNPAADKRLRRVARDLRISDRHSFVRHPQQVGAATTNELWTEGLTHTYTDGVGITTEVSTSAADLGDWWIWDVSQWDVSTFWG